MMIPLIFSFIVFASCDSDLPRRQPVVEDTTTTDTKFYFGADLSYVNQILDKGGVYYEGETATDPYEIFGNHGANLARFRLWHNPAWSKEIYGDEGTQLYNDLFDVEKAIQKAKAAGMEVLLDFHYSDRWADPGNQVVPDAWKNITNIDVLADSVYDYTFQVLTYLDSKGLMPELVQVGNETNCGMLLTGGVSGFPDCNVCDGNWTNAAKVFRAGITAVNDVDDDTKVILHVADPKNITWWFNGMKNNGNLSSFDMIGVSYYPLWHRDIPFSSLETTLAGFKTTFNKEIIILETAYPWTTQGADSYPNHFGGDTPLTGYPYSLDGQLKFLKELHQIAINAGTSGVVYWEPAWITSDLKDLWNTGSSWESNTLFDFDGKVSPNIDYMNFDYELGE